MFFEVLSMWQVVVVAVILMFLLPFIFFVASLNQRPARIRRQPVKLKPAVPVQQNNGEHNQQPEEKTEFLKESEDPDSEQER